MCYLMSYFLGPGIGCGVSADSHRHSGAQDLVCGSHAAVFPTPTLMPRLHPPGVALLQQTSLTNPMIKLSRISRQQIQSVKPKCGAPF